MFEWKSEVSLGSVQESEGSRSHEGGGGGIRVLLFTTEWLSL